MRLVCKSIDIYGKGKGKIVHTALFEIDDVVGKRLKIYKTFHEIFIFPRWEDKLSYQLKVEITIIMATLSNPSDPFQKNHIMNLPPGV